MSEEFVIEREGQRPLLFQGDELGKFKLKDVDDRKGKYILYKTTSGKYVVSLKLKPKSKDSPYAAASGLPQEFVEHFDTPSEAVEFLIRKQGSLSKRILKMIQEVRERDPAFAGAQFEIV